MKPVTLLSSLMAVALLILGTHTSGTAAMRPDFSYLPEASDRAERLRRTYFPNMDHGDSSSVEAGPSHQVVSRPSLFSRLKFWDRTEQLPEASRAQEALDRTRTEVKAAKEHLSLLLFRYKDSKDGRERYERALIISDAEDALSRAQAEYNYAIVESNGQKGEMLHGHPTLQEEIRDVTRRAEATFDAEWADIQRRPPTDPRLVYYMFWRLRGPDYTDELDLTRHWVYYGVLQRAYEDLFGDLWTKGRWANAVKLFDDLVRHFVPPPPPSQRIEWEKKPSALYVQLRDVYDPLLEAERNERWDQQELLNAALRLRDPAEQRYREMRDAWKQLSLIRRSEEFQGFTWPDRTGKWLKWACDRREAENTALYQLTESLNALVDAYSERKPYSPLRWGKHPPRWEWA